MLRAPAAGDADLREIYSCFPAAVQVQSEALGIDPWTGWTVSGGMTFGGGPLNNFVLQSTAAVARALRAGAGRTAIVTAVSGMITKVGAVAWQVGPLDGSDAAALSIDVTDEAAARTPTCTVDAALEGELTVVAHTVVHDKGEPSRAILFAESPDGTRTIATSTDPEVITACTERDLVGTTVTVKDAEVTALA